MDKFEKINGEAANEITDIAEVAEEQPEVKKERRFFSFFTFWKKASKETQDEEFELVEPTEKKGIFKYVNVRTGALVASVAIIAVAGYINLRYTSIPDAVSGEGVSVIDESDTSMSAIEEETASQDYFALSVINRQRVRDEAMEILLDLTNSEAMDTEARVDAYNEMTRMANEITNEANIESLVKAKGFNNCVAVVSKDDVNVVVESDGLTVNEVAQIKEIVYLECGVHPDNVKIIEKSIV